MKFFPLFPNFKRKAFTLSYDDGVKQDLVLLEKFNKYCLKCTFNINTGLSETEKIRNGIDCSVMKFPDSFRFYSGHEIATHTFSHPHIDELNYQEQYDEYKKDIDNIKEETGQNVIGSAYPYGVWNKESFKALTDNNIKYARTVFSTYKFLRPFNFLLWHPTIHHNDPKLMECLDEFLKSEETMSVFYLWGHSYEFALQNNFELIDEVAKKLQEYDDIYYVTNGELYEYFSATDLVMQKERDGKTTIVNYSDKEIYGLLDGRKIILQPHQKLVL